jgi:pimeloyl-ACP methyl ester carboxylesterase
MKNFRIYGKKPCRVVVVHGGPGAPGSIAPVARELSKDINVLEPFQSAHSVDGQVAELAAVLKEYGEIPIILIGWSWGAILSCITTVHFPALVKKLILVGTPPLKIENDYDLSHVWLSRLSEEERIEYITLGNFTWNGVKEDKSVSMERLFRLIAKADSYLSIPLKNDVLEYQLDINIAVGMELRKMMASGELVRLGKEVTCPVVAIHGDYDPRPAGMVRKTLAGTIKDLKFILLGKCGHTPWMEKYARDKFFEILKEEIA